MSRREIILLRQALALVPQTPRIKELLARADGEVRPVRPAIRMREKLTPHQEKVVACFKEGLSSHAVARAVGVEFKSIWFHLTAIYLHYNVETLHGFLTKVLKRKSDLELAEYLVKLSPQERRVFDLFCEGYGNYEIGILERSSNRTVGFHMNMIYKKFGLRAGFKEKRQKLVALVFEPPCANTPKVPVQKGPGPLPEGCAG